jgi:hypothetical protein
MKRNLLLVAAIAAGLGVVIAAGAAQRVRDLTQDEMVAHIESTYRGKVTAIQRDTSGDQRVHYHVLLQIPRGALARFDVDAATRKVMTHQSGPVPPGAGSPGEAAMLVATALRGHHVTMVEFDAGDGVAPHYDVDVRVPTGIAQLKVDAATRWIGWRQTRVIQQASMTR